MSKPDTKQLANTIQKNITREFSNYPMGILKSRITENDNNFTIDMALKRNEETRLKHLGRIVVADGRVLMQATPKESEEFFNMVRPILNKTMEATPTFSYAVIPVKENEQETDNPPFYLTFEWTRCVEMADIHRRHVQLLAASSSLKVIAGVERIDMPAYCQNYCNNGLGDIEALTAQQIFEYIQYISSIRECHNTKNFNDHYNSMMRLFDIEKLIKQLVKIRAIPAPINGGYLYDSPEFNEWYNKQKSNTITGGQKTA